MGAHVELVHYVSGEACFALDVNYPLKVAGFDPALTGWFCPAADNSILCNYGEAVEFESTGDGVNRSWATKFYNQVYGGSFFDKEGRQNWLSLSPTFKAHQIESPLLVIRRYWYGGIGVRELVSAFRQNVREIDLVLVPHAGHMIFLPQEWAAAMQLNVEWMAFWLQDRELSPEKKEQYWYWRYLKRQRDERWAKEGNPYEKAARLTAEGTNQASLRSQASIP
ncbi:MAG: hypothetical protein KF897_14165 [Opitutaceae bacterium]|nr:hypothetical protein [Opitutaceae bacterium]